MKEFSRELYMARLKLKKSLRQVANDIEISAMYLSELENGLKFPKRSDVLPKLADYYNLSYEELLTLMDEERTRNALIDAKEGNLNKVIAAARKSPELSLALSELLKSGGLSIEPN